MPNTMAELEAMSWTDMKLVFALSYAQAIRAVLDHGDTALRSEVERWDPDERTAVAAALANVS
jgi:hypothetical protein